MNTPEEQTTVTSVGTAVAAWKPEYMACKAFKAGQKRKTMVQPENEPEEITGVQMRLEDFIDKH